MIIGSLSESTYLKHRSGLCEDEDARASSFTIALAVLIAVQAATPAWAWGRLGHRVISRIAENTLNPKAKAAIAELLSPGESLADASTWADETPPRAAQDCTPALRRRSPG